MCALVIVSECKDTASVPAKQMKIFNAPYLSMSHDLAGFYITAQTYFAIRTIFIIFRHSILSKSSMSWTTMKIRTLRSIPNNYEKEKNINDDYCHFYVVEYLKGNLERGNTIFKGCRFGEVIDALEAKFLVTKIHCEMDSSSLFMYLYMQTPEYTDDRSIKERFLTGIAMSFEKDSDLSVATKQIMESFPRELYGPTTISLTDENMAKLIKLLNNCKIRLVLFRENLVTMIEFG